VEEVIAPTGEVIAGRIVAREVHTRGGPAVAAGTAWRRGELMRVGGTP